MSIQSTIEGPHIVVSHPCIIELVAGHRIYAADEAHFRSAIQTLIEVGVNFHGTGQPSAIPPTQIVFARSDAPEPVPETAKSLIPQDPLPQTKLFSHYKRLYLSGASRSPITDATYSYYSFVLDFFEALVGDKPVGKIDETDIEAFMDGLAHLPPRTREDPKLPGMSYKSIVARAKREKTQAIAVSTQAKYFTDLRTFFHHLVDTGVIANDPTKLKKKNQYKVKKRTKESFSEADEANIFDPKHDPLLDEPHKYWCPLICKFSAMRINETSQLYVDDIVKINGIWCFYVSADREGQSVKTPNSVRYVPIHSKLIELGLLQYVDELKHMGHVHMFPGLTWGANGPGGNVSTWFNRFLLRGHCGITSKKKSLHVFRHTFGTYAAKAGTLPRVIKRLFGHKVGEDVIDERYIDPADVPECKKAMEEIEFPSIPLLPYTPGRFSKYLTSEKAKLDRKERQEVGDGKRRRRQKTPKKEGKKVS